MAMRAIPSNLLRIHSQNSHTSCVSTSQGMLKLGTQSWFIKENSHEYSNEG